MRHLPAWLRLLLSLVVVPSVAFAQPAPDIILTDFSEPDLAERWRAVNDDVMGGRSTGGPEFVESRLVFSGSTNVVGGGFSSIRTGADGWDGAEAIVLRVRGDGRRYEVDVQTGERAGFFPVAYRAAFEAPAEWTVIRLPVDAFAATARGEPVAARPFDPARARTVGLYIFDGESGPFRLEVDWIGLDMAEAE
ncbi:MAG: CIA30 family protein [Bacteroidota bacterium]